MPSSETTIVEGAQTGLLIAGSWREGTGDVLGSWNPATGALVDSFQSAAEEEIEEAVLAAADAAQEWADSDSRPRPLESWADLLEAEADALADTVVAELGATADEARSEVANGIAALRAAAAGDASDRPLGHVGIVTPWVAPVAVPLSRIGAALASGNTVVWKPPPYASVIATKLAHLARDIPDGVLNIVLGSGDVAVPLARAELAGLHVVGSPGVARWLCREALTVGTRSYAEVSGSAVAVVLAEADLEEATDLIVRAAFSFAGQRSGAIKRVVAHSTVSEQLAERLAARVTTMRVGDPSDSSVSMGPLGDADSVQRATNFVESESAAGAPCHVGGIPLPELGEAFFAPTVLGESFNYDGLVPSDVGPVITLVDADDLDHIVLRVGTPVAVGILGADRDLARQIAATLSTSHVSLGSLSPDNIYETFFGRRTLIQLNAPGYPLSREQEIAT